MPTFGRLLQDADSFPCSDGRALVTRFQAPEAGTLTHVSMWFDNDTTAGSSAYGLFFADNAGEPGARIQQSASPLTIPAGGGLLTWPMSSFSLVSGAWYWIGYCGVGYTARHSQAAGVGATRMMNNTYNYTTPPANWDTAGDNPYNNELCAYATYDVASSGISATVAATLGVLSSAGTATIRVTGVLNQSLANLTLASTSQARLAAALSQTLGPVSLASTSQNRVSAALGQSLAPLSLSALAQGGTVNLSGNMTLGDLAIASSAQNLVKGQVTQSLDSMQGNIAAALPLRGVLSQTLGEVLINSMIAGSGINAQVAQTLGEVQGSIDLEVLVKGVVASTLEPIAAVLTVSVPVNVTVDQVLQAVSMMALGEVQDAGLNVNATLGDATLQSEAIVITHAEVSSTLQSVAAQAQGRTLISGTVDRELGSIALSAFGVIGDGPKLKITLKIPNVVTGVKVPAVVSSIKIPKE